MPNTRPRLSAGRRLSTQAPATEPGIRPRKKAGRFPRSMSPRSRQAMMADKRQAAADHRRRAARLQVDPRNHRHDQKAGADAAGGLHNRANATARLAARSSEILIGYVFVVQRPTAWSAVAAAGAKDKPGNDAEPRAAAGQPGSRGLSSRWRRSFDNFNDGIDIGNQDDKTENTVHFHQGSPLVRPAAASIINLPASGARRAKDSTRPQIPMSRKSWP